MANDAFIIRRGGSGGAALNFKIIGSTTQPTGTENTIWVNTSTAISSWVFSATQPVSPASGMVWIMTASSSPAAINVLKKNGVWVYPSGCKQYVSGAWVSKTAKTYINGSWQDWRTYLFNNGDKCVSVTGDYNCSLRTGSTSSDKAEITSTDIHLLSNGSYSSSRVYSNNPIVTTGFKKLYFTVKVPLICSYNDGVNIGFCPTPTSGYEYLKSDFSVIKSYGSVVSTYTTDYLNIASLTGTQYLTITTAWSGEIYIKEIWLE